MYPRVRMRRLRRTEQLRELAAETSLSPTDFVYPLFVRHGEAAKHEIESMPGNYQMSIDNLVDECFVVRDLGILGVLLFGIPAVKNEMGSEAVSDEGIVQQAVRAIKERIPDLLVITDVCFCEYTDHGHCGVVTNGAVDNDATLKLLAQQSVSHARAGADIVAPSDMMDGRVGAIRDALDGEGFTEVAVLSYAVKYSSAFYGPFREAADSKPQFGDRKAYQMDFRNSREALREIELDISEGADIVMVKPALAYLDIIRTVRNRFSVPIAAYNVSGEYSCLRAAAERGWIDGDAAMMEVLYAIKRAGADIIISYHAKRAAELLA